MIALALCAVLSQAPVQKVAVVSPSDLGIPARRAAELVKNLVDVIRSVGLEPVEARQPCDNRACLIATGKELKAVAVISVAFAAVGKDVVVDLEGVQTSDGHKLAQTTFTVRSGEARPLTIDASAFVSDVKQALPPSPAQPLASDTPKSSHVKPEATPREPDLTEPSEPSSRQPPYAFLVATTSVFAVAAATFWIVARVEQNGIPATASLATQHDWDGLRDQANRNYSIGWGAAGVAIAAAATTLILYLLSD